MSFRFAQDISDFPPISSAHQLHLEITIKNGVARGTVHRDAVLFGRMQRENDEMRRMMWDIQYSRRLTGVHSSGGASSLGSYQSGFSPFPSANSAQMQQYTSGMSPHGDIYQHQRDVPNQTPNPGSDLPTRPNPERPDQTDTTVEGSDGNGRNPARTSLPSVNIPCVIM